VGEMKEENESPVGALRELAERAMQDKRRESCDSEVGDEDQIRELWDLPTETSGELAAQQKEER